MTFINIVIIDLNVLLYDLNLRKVAIYFSNRCIAKMLLLQLNTRVYQTTALNKTGSE